MIKLSAPDGSQVSIDGQLVVRMRKTISGEQGQTRIDWEILSLVQQALDDVVPLVKKDLPSLTVLTTLKDRLVWFDAKQAVGPLPITSPQKDYGFRSSIKVMGYRQYVIEGPDEVRAVIAAAGGTPLGERPKLASKLGIAVPEHLEARPEDSDGCEDHSSR